MSARPFTDPLDALLDTLVPVRDSSARSESGRDLPSHPEGVLSPRLVEASRAFAADPDLNFEEDDLFQDAEYGKAVYLEPQGHGGALQRSAVNKSDAPATQQFPWSAKLCLDLALGFDSEEQILLQHNIDQPTFERFKRMPAFRRDLAVAMATIRDEGLTFKAKCRVFSEEYLDTIYSQLHDSSVGVSQRFYMFKQMVRLGGLEPKPEKAEADAFASMPRIAIQINL